MRILYMDIANIFTRATLPGEEKRRGWRRIRGTAVATVLLGIVAFASSGCYDDRYYGRRVVGTGYYASYGSPYYGGYSPYYGPGYGYDYGYGYGPYYGGTSVAVGISSNRGRYYRGGSRHRRGYYRQANIRRRSEFRRSGQRAGNRPNRSGVNRRRISDDREEGLRSRQRE